MLPPYADYATLPYTLLLLLLPLSPLLLTILLDDVDFLMAADACHAATTIDVISSPAAIGLPAALMLDAAAAIC